MHKRAKCPMTYVRHSAAVINSVAESNLERQGFISVHSGCTPLGREFEAGTKAKALKEQLKQASSPRLSRPFFYNQDHLPRSETVPRG